MHVPRKQPSQRPRDDVGGGSGRGPIGTLVIGAWRCGQLGEVVRRAGRPAQSLCRCAGGWRGLQTYSSNPWPSDGVGRRRSCWRLGWPPPPQPVGQNARRVYSVHGVIMIMTTTMIMIIIITITRIILYYCAWGPKIRRWRRRIAVVV